MARNVDDIRNIAVCGHGSSGKTTLVDQLAREDRAQSPASPASTPAPASATSTKKRSTTSIRSRRRSSISIMRGKRFNVIDTPGYPDLIGQTIGALRAVETALIAIDAHAGIKVNTRRVWQEAGDAGLGRILCITKLDTDNIDFPGLIDSIKEVFGTQCALFNVPIGQGHDLKGVVSTLDVPKDTAGALIDPAKLSESVMESIIEADEAVMEKYLEGEMPSKEELAAAVRRGRAARHAHADRVRLDEDGHRTGRAAGRARAGLAAADRHSAHGEEGRRRRDAQSATRPRRWPRRCSRRASIRSSSG